MEAYCQLAIALSEAGRADEATKAFEKATKFGLSLPMPDTLHVSEVCEKALQAPYEELMGATVAREEFSDPRSTRPSARTTPAGPTRPSRASRRP